MNYLDRTINVILDEKNLSYKWLAEQIGYSRQGLKSGLSNKTIKFNALERIAEVLDVRMKVFIEEDYRRFYEFLIPEYLIFDKKVEYLSKRYIKFSERINFYKDYYFYRALLAIINDFMPEFKCIRKDFSGNIIQGSKVEVIKQLHSELKLENTPYSQLSLQHKSIIDNTLIFDGFYFPIFDINFLNINEYLEDGLVINKEINQYWDDWKNK